MSILWFFLIVSWSGDVQIRHHYTSFERCDEQRKEAVLQFKKTVRAITDCVGIPIEGGRDER